MSITYGSKAACPDCGGTALTLEHDEAMRFLTSQDLVLAYPAPNEGAWRTDRAEEHDFSITFRIEVNAHPFISKTHAGIQATCLNCREKHPLIDLLVTWPEGGEEE